MFFELILVFMRQSVLDKQDEILEAALEDVAIDGWSWDIIEKAAESLGNKDAAMAVFPGQLGDVVAHFSHWADRRMLEKLEAIDPESMRIRDRVRLGVQTRLNVLKPHKEAVRHSLGYWMRPFRKIRAGKIVWNTADAIWVWAGDTSTDYNHYTKRILLSGVVSSTTLAWLQDMDDDLSKTLSFLDNRIENVMQLGKVMSKFKRPQSA